MRDTLQKRYNTKVHIPVFCLDCNYNRLQERERISFESTLADIFATSKIFKPYELDLICPTPDLTFEDQQTNMIVWSSHKLRMKEAELFAALEAGDEVKA